MDTNIIPLGRRVLILAIALFGSQAVAQSITTPLEIDQAWRALNRGQAIVLMRHALAPGTGDPAEFDIDDCSTQRNLSVQGRRQAREIGDTLRNRGITRAHVLSSYWCRCIETAKLLGLGRVTETDALNSFFEDRANQETITRKAQETIVSFLSNPLNIPTVMVTHQVNITALTGEAAQPGEIKIVTLENNEIQVMASFQAQ